MACKAVKKKLLATLVTGKKAPCAFCQREVDDEITYGKLYAIGDIQCHYFCVLLSCCLIQKGKDNEGLFGFMYPDILAEVERSKKHKCSYCGKGGAGLGCCIAQCRKQFHLPCGREKNAISLFFGNYKSYCQLHAPKQKIPTHIMDAARLRMKKARKPLKALPSAANIDGAAKKTEEPQTEPESVCVICYEEVEGYPSVQTFWPPCCARDAWFHRTCVQRMALNAGMHYLKCPLCNDKELFHEAVVQQGYYVPDRDAAWELEQNAFAEIYERPLSCDADECKCPMGRTHDAETGSWDIKLCILCGTYGRHADCFESEGRFVCKICKPAAPSDLEKLASSIEAVIISEQATRGNMAVRRVMPARMSLRRTKQPPSLLQPSTSQNGSKLNDSITEETKFDTLSSRLSLNLKPPRKTRLSMEQPKQSVILKNIENTLLSPTKLVEESLSKKMQGMNVNVDAEKLIVKVKDRLKKPRPLSEKKRIVDNLLEDLLSNIMKEVKEKNKPKEWCSPKKTCDISKDEEIRNTATDTEDAKPTPPKTEISELPEESPNKSEEPKKESLTEGEGKIEEENTKEDLNVDDSSNSTFKLPSEFIADHNSDDSLPIFDTPQKLKTVDIEKDSSLEISEHNEVVNIDVVKMESPASEEVFRGFDIKNLEAKEKVVLKFSPNQKKLQQVDIESFKNQYLTEVDKDFKCKFNHKHKQETTETPKTLRTAISFAIDATLKKEQKGKKLKRKLKNQNEVEKKKAKLESDVKDDVETKKDKKTDSAIDSPKRKTEKKLKKLKKKLEKKRKMQLVDVTIDSTDTRKNRKKLKIKNRSSARENIHLKIRFKEKHFKLQILKSDGRKIKKKKNKSKKFKKQKMEQKKLNTTMTQYVLSYSEDVSHDKKVIVKPDPDATPIPHKKKKEKSQKTPDTLIQTSIQSFFKKV